MALKIGLVGAGKMGAGIGSNLMKKGHALFVVAHHSRQVVDDLVGQGARELTTPQDIAAEADVVLLCVTGSPAVEAVMFARDGVVAGLGEGKLVIDCSTGEPGMVDRVGKALAEMNVDFVDAPLARTPVEAASGTLNTMVGGSDAAFERARPVLECFCENIFHMGDIGAGTRTKLINNLITMGQASLIAEALSACVATGVDLRRFYNVISSGGGNSGIFQMVVPAILDEGSFGGMKFSLANAAKDLGYFVTMAQEAGIENRFGTEVHQVLVQAMDQGLQDGLVAGLVDAAAKRNKLTIGKQ